MQSLAKLCNKTVSHSAKELFYVKNFYQLEYGIVKFATDQTNHGLNVALATHIKSTAKFLRTQKYESRKPANLPSEEDLKKLNLFVATEISMLSKHQRCTRLVKLVLACLTLLNTQRGGEVSRAKINDCMERNSWINQNIDKISKNELLDKYNICFIMGKGSTKGPILIPKHV